MGDLVQWERNPKLGWNRAGVTSTKTCNIFETVHDKTKVTMTNKSEVAYALSIRTKITNLG